MYCNHVIFLFDNAFVFTEIGAVVITDYSAPRFCNQNFNRFHNDILNQIRWPDQCNLRYKLFPQDYIFSDDV